MNIALIIGCARSGTSILGELIGSHPDVKYIFEAHSVWERAGYGENESHRLTDAHATPRVVSAIREWFSGQRDLRAVLVEKNPRNTLRIPFIRRIFPEAKIIHIIRDGRDVACSLVPGIGGTEWMHLKPQTWKTLFHEEPIIRCALTWREVVRTALNDLIQVPHLMVKYEDLVTAPERVTADILNYLELSASLRVQEFCQLIKNPTQDSYHASHSKRWYRDDHVVRVGRWKENMDLKDQGRVKQLLENMLRELGYIDESIKISP